MKFLEFEAKNILKAYGVPVPKGILVKSIQELEDALPSLPEKIVLKAQVDVGGRGKAGGIIITDKERALKDITDLFSRSIKGRSVNSVLVEEALEIKKEYYCSIIVDRKEKSPVIIFTDEGGVEIEVTAQKNPHALRKARITPLLQNVPDFILRSLLRGAQKEIGPVINALFRVFVEKDAILAEINPLVLTESGIYAADAKLIIDDNSLARQGITVNRDLTERERTALIHGFSYVELKGSIGVIGNGAGLTMATLDLIEYSGEKAANFLDVGGGADQERVAHALRLVASDPSVKVVVVNLLGGITRCDEVAKGIIAANVAPHIIVRLAGTNEKEGKIILESQGYEMVSTMEEAIQRACQVVK